MKKILTVIFCLLSISIFSQNTEKVAVVAEILPSQGFSLGSLWRGVLGMFALIIIAFFLSLIEGRANMLHHVGHAAPSHGDPV